MVRTRSGEHSTGSVSMPVSGVAQRLPRPPINRGKAPVRQETFGEGPFAPRVVPARQEMVGEGLSAPRIGPHDGAAMVRMEPKKYLCFQQYHQLAADELEHFRRKDCCTPIIEVMGGTQSLNLR
ncbi:hypothetical protein Dimus_007986 [Dionaea muscipula]